MESERAHKIDGAVRKLRAVMEAFDMKGTNRATMLNAINTINALRTRPAPAATDTGLVTVGFQCSNNAVEWCETLIPKVREQHGYKIRELVTRSQAEELLAAEIKLKQHWKDEAERFRIEFEKAAYEYLLAKARAEKAEADNAAQAARIKELDKSEQELIEIATRNLKEKEALEAKLAAAEKALEPFAEHANDRAVDDTGWRDKETVKIVVSIGDLRKARAVLGGKPS